MQFIAKKIKSCTNKYQDRIERFFTIISTIGSKKKCRKIDRI